MVAAGCLNDAQIDIGIDAWVDAGIGVESTPELSLESSLESTLELMLESVMAFDRSKPDTDRRRDRRSSSMGRSALDWLVPIIESVPKRSFRDIGRFGFILSSSQAGRIGPWFSNTRPGIGHVNDDVGIPDIYYVHI